jgi:uncharacterized membrane protein YkvA (DUF1232 family)
VNVRAFIIWWRTQAAELKTSITTLICALRHPGTPWYARVFVALIVAYAVSPIDLIPDFIPIFGYLDDLILIPLGLFVAAKMIPGDVWTECRTRSRGEPIPRSLYYLGLGIVFCAWIATAYLLYCWLF